MFDSITKFFADVKATAVVGYETFTGDVTSAVANAKADVADQVEVSNVNVSVTYKVAYAVAAAFFKAVAWTYRNDVNLNITTAILTVPAMPVVFGFINIATVIAMVLSFAAITELFVPVSANIGMSATMVRVCGYSAAVIKAAICLGLGALFM